MRPPRCPSSRKNLRTVVFPGLCFFSVVGIARVMDSKTAQRTQIVRQSRPLATSSANAGQARPQSVPHIEPGGFLASFKISDPSTQAPSAPRLHVRFHNARFNVLHSKT